MSKAFSLANLARLLKPSNSGKGLMIDSIGNATTIEGSLSHRNKIINGNFDIWQRGTSFTNLSGNLYTADRWMRDGFASGSLSYSRTTFAPNQTDVPGSPKYYMSYSVSSILNTPLDIRQVIESVYTLAGKSATLSFYAISSIAQPMTVYLNQVIGTGGSPVGGTTNIIATINLTTSWQKFVISTTLPSLPSNSVLGTNNNDGLQLRLVTSTAVQSVSVAQVQLEEGTVATPFEQRHIGTELALCQRYYWTSLPIGTPTGSHLYTEGYVASAANNISTNIVFPVPMRTSIIATSIVGTWTVVNCPQPNVSVFSNVCMLISSASSAAGRTYFYGNGITQYITADAEL